MWIGISIILIVITSFIAFKLGAKIFITEKVKEQNILSLASALTMGLGIWSMHFIGLLSVNLPGEIDFHPFIQLLSIFPGILGSVIALCLLWRLGTRLPLPLRGTMFGSCILVMHYIGMMGMHFDGYLIYNPPLFALSILIAVTLSCLTFYLHNRLQNQRLIVASVGIGLAVSATHYTGIEAAYFVKESAAFQPPVLLIADMTAVKVSASLLFLTLGISVYILISQITSTSNKLHQSERRWRFALDGAGDGVWDWNPQTDEAAFSRRWNEILGYEENEFPATGAAVFKAIHPEDLHDVKKSVLGHVRKGGSSSYKKEFRMQTRDGGWIWVVARGKVLERDASNSPVRMIGTITDITDRKQAEEQMRIAATAFQSQQGIMVTDANGKILQVNTDITEKKSAEKKIDNLAYYDQLTGLPNKIQLMHILEQALALNVRNNQYSAILMIDLDHFNKLNATLGHIIGDQLLVQVARLLEESTSSIDTVARFGGDKFVVILPELSSDKIKAARSAESTTQNILRALNRDYKLGRASHHSTVSIGVSLFGREVLTIDVLMKQAELAMYESKSAGRNTMSCYDPRMQSSVSKLVTMERELRSALDKKEFIMHYQPQVSLQNGRITGVEALIRWNGPKLGLVSPAEFIPVLEEMELIVDVGNWVMLESCEQLKRWHQSGFDHLRVGINVSPAQFKSKNFLDRVRDILKKTRVPPGCVELEITESVVMDDPQYAESLLNDLHKLGLKIAIDDFGTGYSSLSNLMNLPFDTLKIDRAFVKGLPGDADSVSFCEAIIALAKALKLHTIAEGIEEVSQLQFLNRIGCTIIQGFYFSKPLPPREVEKMLQDGTRLSVSDRRSDFTWQDA
jgi:diguanylate cyclase (GGDEF)-like protein/PAS domain S-box-containing protein